MNKTNCSIKIFLENKYLCEIKEWPKSLDELKVLDQRLPKRRFCIFYYDCENEKKVLKQNNDFELLRSIDSCRPKTKELYLEFDEDTAGPILSEIIEEPLDHNVNLLQSEYIPHGIHELKQKWHKVKYYSFKESCFYLILQCFLLKRKKWDNLLKH